MTINEGTGMDVGKADKIAAVGQSGREPQRQKDLEEEAQDDGARDGGEEQPRKLGEAFAIDGLLAGGVTPEVQRALDGLSGQIEPLRAELELARGRVTRLQEEANMHPFLPLPNRREFLRELGLVLSHQQPGSVPPALAIVHFSGAEAIRIQAGRAALDGALQHAYSLMTVVLGGTDVIGSLGGNDFGIILLAGDPESVTCKRADLTAAIHDQPFVWQGVEYRFNPQIGFAAITGDVMPERVLETADRDLLSK